jgi:hypothetical protein
MVRRGRLRRAAWPATESRPGCLTVDSWVDIWKRDRFVGGLRDCRVRLAKLWAEKAAVRGRTYCRPLTIVAVTVDFTVARAQPAALRRVV